MSDVAFARNDARLAFDEIGHCYTLGELRLTSVTQVLALVGLSDFSSPWFSEAVKDRGTFLHQAIALDVEGDLNDETLDPELRGGLDGWRAFVRDTGATIEHAERMLCDPDQRVAGRLDYIVTMRVGFTLTPIRVLIDVKRALYPCAAVQTAAYADMAAALYTGPVYFKRAALVLPGDGSYRFQLFHDPQDRATWQAALRIHAWRLAHGID